MSRDLSCNETLSTLDDGDTFSVDVRRIRQPMQLSSGPSSSTAIGTASSSSVASAYAPSPYSPQISLISGVPIGGGGINASSFPPNITHTSTVREVVSSRMRNKGISLRGNDSLAFQQQQQQGLYGSAINRLKNNSNSTAMRPTTTTIVGNTANLIESLLAAEQANSHSLSSNALVMATQSLQHQQQPTVKYITNTMPTHQQPYGSSIRPATSVIGIAYGNGSGVGAINSRAPSTSTSTGIFIGSGGTDYSPTTGFAGSGGGGPFMSGRQHLNEHYVSLARPSSYPAEMTVGHVVRAANSPSKFLSSSSSSQPTAVRGASPYAVVMPSQTRAESLARESPSGAAGTTTPTPGGGGGASQPNAHSSPRPSILRGNMAARRLADKEQVRPASVPGIEISSSNNNVINAETSTVANGEFTNANATTTYTASNSQGNTQQTSTNSSGGEGEDSSSRPGDDSPRKRPRKQQFDSTQLTQDKLMMEVRADPKFDQQPGDAPQYWPSSSIQQSLLNIRAASNPSHTATDYHHHQYAGNAELIINREPKKRGRPRSINRTFGGADASAGAAGGVYMMSSSMMMAGDGSTASLSAAPPLTNTFGQQPPPAPASAVRSFMVEVDSMLQAPPTTVRRKYKKRVPEVDPETGEIIKKPRKKGSGRKSKKDLLLLEAAKQACVAGSDAMSTGTTSHVSMLKFAAAVQQYSTYGGAYPQQNHHPQPNSSISTFARLDLEERGVVSSLCRLKANTKLSEREKSQLKASIRQYEANGSGRSSRQSSVLNEENEDGKGQGAEAVPSIPFHIDPVKFACLRPVWKRADKSSEDSLSTHYDDVSAFLAKSTSNEGAAADGLLPCAGDNLSLKPSEFGPRCQVFDSYEQFDNARQLLRLLPASCSYMQSSRRLVSSLKNNLISHSLFKRCKRLINSPRDEAGQLVSLSHTQLKPIGEVEFPQKEKNAGDNASDGDSYEEDEDCAPIFRRMESIVAERGAMDGKGDESEQRTNEFLVELDVAELVDEMLDSVCSLSLPAPKHIKKEVQKEEEQGLTGSVIFSPAITHFPSTYKAIIASKRALLPLKNTNKKEKRRRRRKAVSSDDASDIDTLVGDDTDNNKGNNANNSNNPALQRRKAEIVIQKLEEIDSQSRKHYQSMCRLSMRLLKSMERKRYADAMAKQPCISTDNHGCGCGGSNQQLNAALKKDAELAFLLQSPQCKASFKPAALIYSPFRSVTLDPSRHVINGIFKDKLASLQRRKQHAVNGGGDKCGVNGE